MHNINHKWSMAVFESILFHVFLIAFLVAAGSFFMASLPESSPIEVDLVDTTAGLREAQVPVPDMARLFQNQIQ